MMLVSGPRWSEGTPSRREWLRACAAGVLVACAQPEAEPNVPRGGPPALPESEDGYELWLRYRAVQDAALLARYRELISHVVVPGESPTLVAVRDELDRGLGGLFGVSVPKELAVRGPGALLAGTPRTLPAIASWVGAEQLTSVGPEGFVLRSLSVNGAPATIIAANSDVGVLYGVFALLRELQQERAIDGLSIASAPKVKSRMLNHWDNLDRSVERGYAGRSLWEWEQLPSVVSPRYRDYARACASLGINATVLTNVNANAQVLTPAYLSRVQVLANELRPYGLRVLLTARFSAPIEIGGLSTADPLAPEVRRWWADKAREIYALIPDFGGFLVKANSEGQPGPQEYGRTHADGANVLADALAPHGGSVVWRAFVYSDTVPVDRIKQAYDEFKPLDGAFRPNVLVQAKNGALDFQPREPFHPLFGAMPKTPLALELQITKEYLGQDTHVAFLGPLYEEVLKADTFVAGPGSTVARVVDGSLHRYSHTAIAGVANVGDDRDWCGSHMNQANWYVFGRMAWDPDLTAASVAEEWVRATFGNDAELVRDVVSLLLGSHQAVVDYMTPLGLVHLMATGHHYGPAPWVRDLKRPEWNPAYYHRADASGIGFDRTASGSNAVAQYHPQVAAGFADRATVTDAFLLFFHRVGWSERLRSGRTLWEELVMRYDAGVSAVRHMRELWARQQGKMDARRHGEVAAFLEIQEHEAKWWRDASIAYFREHSRLPLPSGHAAPAHPLSFYQGLTCPSRPEKPRCPEVYDRGA